MRKKRPGCQIKSKTTMLAGPIAFAVDKDGCLVVQPISQQFYDQEISKIKRYQANRKPGTSLRKEEK